MVVLSIAAAVVAVTLVVLVAFMIPAIIEIRKSAVEFRVMANRLDSELQPILHELRGTLADLQILTESASERAGNVATFLDAIGDTGRNLRVINSVAGAVAGAITSSSMWLTGTRVAAKFIIDRLIQKKGDEHHG